MTTGLAHIDALIEKVRLKYGPDPSAPVPQEVVDAVERLKVYRNEISIEIDAIDREQKEIKRIIGRADKRLVERRLKRVERRFASAEAKVKRHTLVKELTRIVSDDGRTRHRDMLAASKRFEAVLAREGVPRTPEALFRPSLLLMAFGLWVREALGPDQNVWPEPWELGAGCRRVSEFVELSHQTWDSLKFARAAAFASAWASVSFPVVRVGAKQAAAMMLTEPPDVPAPWPAVWITVPDGLVSVGGAPVRYIACHELAVGLILLDPHGPIDHDPSGAVLRMCQCLRGSLYAALEARTHVVESEYRGASKHRNRGYMEAPPPGTCYEVRAPVQIDLREVVHEVCSGRAGRRPTIQFVVRGHWRNQACGTGHTLRRRQWIEPYWKGPKDGVAAIRAYVVSDSNGLRDVGKDEG